MNIKKYAYARGLACAFLALSVVACAGPQTTTSSKSATAAPSESPPVQSGEQLQVTQAARQGYVSCLNRAARYADDHNTAPDNLATLIAPMCYPQFAALQVALEDGMSRGEQQTQIRDGDKLQVQLASEAVTRVRSQAALTVTK